MSGSRIALAATGLALVVQLAGCRSGASRAEPEAPVPTPSGLAGVAVSGSGAAVTTVSGKKLEQRHATQIQELLMGLPGVEVTGSGANMRVRIRGTNTLNGDTEPLYVVDGTILASGLQGLLTIDPQDVARIDVLKDAGSTALYGLQGANGVIVITTKRAR